jgi:hypothetical protein
LCRSGELQRGDSGWDDDDSSLGTARKCNEFFHYGLGCPSTIYDESAISNNCRNLSNDTEGKTSCQKNDDSEWSKHTEWNYALGLPPPKNRFRYPAFKKRDLLDHLTTASSDYVSTALCVDAGQLRDGTKGAQTDPVRWHWHD